MFFSRISLAVATTLVTTSNADIHQLIVGTFRTESLYTLEFDDVAFNLSLVQNLSTNAASSWLTLSHDKRNLYGNSFNAPVPSFVGYTLNSATDIQYNMTLQMGGNCTSTAIYVVAATEPPYAVYGTPFGNSANCGSVMSVDENGSLAKVIQDYTYSNTSAVHGMALDRSNSYIYSADDRGNTLWTHKVDRKTGELSLLSSIPGPTPGADPRHVAVHSGGTYLYVVLEGSNQLAQYSIDSDTGIPFFENVTYPLIPAGSQSSQYWSDEVAISFSQNYLWATSRARPINSTGYISAFSLAPNGRIIAQLFLGATTSSGGAANSVAPSEFSDKFVALTDSSTGFVEIWSLEDNGSSAKPVAHLALRDGGCCANAVWYS